MDNIMVQSQHTDIASMTVCIQKLHLDTEAASIVRGIFDQRLAGMSYADIARDLNEKELETPTVYLQRKGWAPETKKSVQFWDGNLVKQIYLIRFMQD